MRKRQEIRVYPIDTQKSVAVGFKIPFNAKGIFGQNYTTAAQIKSNVINFLLTNEGERVFNNNFGANLRGTTFNQMNSLDELKEALLDKIKSYFPQISNTDLDLRQKDGDSSLYITLKYSFNKLEDSLFIQVTN